MRPARFFIALALVAGLFAIGVARERRRRRTPWRPDAQRDDRREPSLTGPAKIAPTTARCCGRP